MLVSKKYKFVFLCTPKNASNSVEDMLAPYSEISFLGRPEFRHINVRNYEKYISPLISKVSKEDDLVKIALIREPVSWMYSWYRFHSRVNLRNPSHLQHLKSTKGVSFEAFIEGYLKEDPPSYSIIGPTQFEFLTNYSGNGIDELFLYERIDELVEYMSNKIGKELTLKSKNVSPSKVYDSNLLETFSYIKRKIKEKILRSSHQTKIEEGLLSNNLLERLKEKMPNDFALYEQVQSNKFKSNRNA